MSGEGPRSRGPSSPHSLPGSAAEIQYLSLFRVEVTRPQKNALLFLPSFASISPLVAYFTHTAMEPLLEESGKHQQGMRGISPQPPLTALTSLSLLQFRPLQAAALFQFSLAAEHRPTKTTSHKQKGAC